jgi:uncharacterized glyoxalase superfamily protein PhnB
MQVQAYLFFDGRCEEALQYYSKHLGAKVEMLMRNKESPAPLHWAMAAKSTCRSRRRSSRRASAWWTTVLACTGW